MAAVLNTTSHAGDATLNSAQKLPRRRACNECKQQKLRCNLAADHDGPSICARCEKLGLECKLQPSFQRTRKRRRSHDLEHEVMELRRKLETYEGRGHGLQMPSTPATQPVPQDNRMSSAIEDTPLQPLHTPHAPPGPLYNTTEQIRAPGLTTKPVIDVDQSRSMSLVFSPQPRKLGDIELSVGEIANLFAIYFTNFHSFLPFLDSEKSPHAYYESSPLLFWSIVSVASHRSDSQPTLLPRLARAVTDLLWSTLRSIPYSIHAVQSLAILCAWPFPTSSSTSDPTYTLVGTMIQLAFQMGLHCATNAEDFTKVPLRLSTGESQEWAATWIVCNIVAHSVSIGCGLPAPIMLHDRLWPTEIPQANLTLWIHLRIERYRHRVSVALAPHVSGAREECNSSPNNDRISIYRLLDAVYGDLEREVLAIFPTTLTEVNLSAALFHLHSFYFLDDSSIDGYTDRIARLYQTALRFVSLTLDIDSQDGGLLFHHWPFFLYQVFVAAAFTLLKIIINGSFASKIDHAAGRTLLNSAILALRRMSVANNDLPARLSDVLAFLYSLPANTGDYEDMASTVRLRVRNRLSMSVVYDLLWQWRGHFQNNQNSALREHSPGPYASVHGDHVDLDLNAFALPDAFTFSWPDDAFGLPFQG